MPNDTAGIHLTSQILANCPEVAEDNDGLETFLQERRINISIRRVLNKA